MMESPGYDAQTGATIIASVFPFFPYPERFCPFCEHELVTINAVHANDDAMIYKSIMICNNSDCGAFDEEAKKAYAKVYYSSEEALARFETIMLRFSVETKE